MFVGGFITTRAPCLRAAPLLSCYVSHIAARPKVTAASSSDFYKYLDQLPIGVPLDGTKKLLLKALHNSDIKDGELLVQEKKLLVKDLDMDHWALQVSLKKSNTKLAKNDGLLNYRGIIQLVEDELIAHLEAERKQVPTSRRDLWAKSLRMKKFHSLRNCLRNVSNSTDDDADAVADLVYELYTDPKMKVNTGWGSCVVIKPIHLTKPRARMLACMAEFVVISYCFQGRREGDPDAYAEVGGDPVLLRDMKRYYSF